MNGRTNRRVALSLALAWPSMALGADGADIEQLRGEIRALREHYETRLRALEQRLEQTTRAGVPAAPPGTAGSPAGPAPAGPATGQAAAAIAATAAAPAPEAVTQPSAAQPAGAPTRGTGRGLRAGNAFNPEISLILSGRYARMSRDPATWHIAGVPTPDGVEIGPGARGFGLGESELGIAANIDPYLRGQLRLALTPDNEVAVEEANAQTTSLPHGLVAKFGRFLSGIGYLNEQHPHYWDFVDAPVAYQAFLGRQFGDDGIQLRWVAPTDTFVELGVEAGRGRAFPAAGSGGHGAGAWAVFGHAGGDVGDSHSWRAGASMLRTSARDQRSTAADASGADVVDAFSGHATTWIADMVWRWAPGGDPSRRHFKLQAEVLRQSQSGELTHAIDGPATTDAFRARRTGWYVQGVYQFMPRWRAGLRFDRLAGARIDAGANADALGGGGHAPRRESVMVDYSPSEFARFRIQLARDRVREGVADHQIFLQYQTSLGAHGAHRF